MQEAEDCLAEATRHAELAKLAAEWVPADISAAEMEENQQFLQQMLERLALAELTLSSLKTLLNRPVV